MRNKAESRSVQGVRLCLSEKSRSRAARINRKTYSAIVGNELRPVSKRTAVAFAFALELPRDEADDLLRSAGFALSPSILEDMVFAACLDAGIHDLDRVNRILEAHGARPFLLQKG